MERKWYQSQRRLLEAAHKDKRPERFYREFKEEVKTQTPERFSLRTLFEEFVPNGREMVEEFDPMRGGNQSVALLEAPGAAGAVATADFSNITGQIVYSTVMREFEEGPFIGGTLSTTVPTRFDGEKIPGVSMLGDYVESIGEGDPYPRAKVSEEWIETPNTIKRGVIVDVTKEAVFFDRTNLVLNHASNVGRSIAFNKEKRILDVCFGITNPYKYNGNAYDTYQASTPWDNTATSTALQDWTDVETALLLFDAMTDPITGEPIMPMGKQLVVPSALLFTANRIVNATEIREVTNTNTTSLSSNPLAGQNFSVVSNQFVKNRTSSDTTWFLGDFMRAFAYMENWPIQVRQSGANSYLEFERDIISSYKVSERGAVAVMEPRYVVKVTSA